MNTVIEYTAEQHIDKTGGLLHSLLFLGRKYLGLADTRIQKRPANCAREIRQYVPPRVWRRHSALLDLLTQQTESIRVASGDTE